MIKRILSAITALLLLASLVYAADWIGEGITLRAGTPTPTPTPTPSAGITRANDFLNTLGVTSHVVQGHTTGAHLQAGIQYLGVRRDRDDFTADEYSGGLNLIANVFCPVHNATGVTYIGMPYAAGNVTDLQAEQLEWHELDACGSLFAVEGPNEPNNQPFQYHGVDCNQGTTFQGCVNFQHDIYALKAGGTVINSSIPMFSITEVGAEPDNVGLQFLSFSGVFADYANMHNYVVGNDGVLQDNRSWTAEAPSSAEQCCFDGIDGEFINQTWSKHFPASAPGTNIPRVSTETGWPSNAGISEAKRGTVLTNLYLSAVKRGWSYTLIYQLQDDVDAFGLYDSSFNPKIAATDIHNLTTILADTSSNFTPTALSYTISNEPATVHDLLIEKSSGKYELAVWGDQVTGSNNVTVNLPSATNVSIYDITVGTSPVQTLTNVSAVPLTLSDHAMILEF